VSNPDNTMAFYQRDDGESPRRFWEYAEEAGAADRSAATLGGLADLGFIRAALRRSVRLWSTLAVLGLLAGAAIFVRFPASYEASTSVLLPPPSYQGAMTDDQAYAQSRTVAGLALSQLKSPQSAASFTSDYTVTAVTDRVLQITTMAPSSAEAINEANALAAAFLTFQADLLKTQEQLVNATLQQQIGQDQQRIDSMDRQISQLSTQPTTSAQQTQLNTLRNQRSQALTSLNALTQDSGDQLVAIQIATDQALKGSQVLDKAEPVAQHGKKRMILYVGGGLIGGLALGLGIVVIRALISDKLRRRDEVACALGVPVKLSVGALRPRRGLAIAKRPAGQKVVAYLGKAVASSSRGPANLAVVPVDDARVPAACLVSLALARAQLGAQVVLADLCAGSPAARLLGITKPGVQQVSVHGTGLTVVVSESEDPTPAGPLDGGSDPGAAGPLSDACNTADLLLTLMTLDPALGGEHLTGWARSAVAVVTAGRASVNRIRAVGEMIRLAGTPIFSGVLVGAEKSDETLGVIYTPRTGQDYVPHEGFTL